MLVSIVSSSYTYWTPTAFVYRFILRAWMGFYGMKIEFKRTDICMQYDFRNYWSN